MKKMDKCAVYECENPAVIKSPCENRIHFQKQWLKVGGEIGIMQKGKKGLCEKHFCPDQLTVNGSKRKRVMKNALTPLVANETSSKYLSGEISSDESSNSSSSDASSTSWAMDVEMPTEPEIKSIIETLYDENLENDLQIQDVKSDAQSITNNQITPISPISRLTNIEDPSPDAESPKNLEQVQLVSSSQKENVLKNDLHISEEDEFSGPPISKNHQTAHFSSISSGKESKVQSPEIEDLMEPEKEECIDDEDCILRLSESDSIDKSSIKSNYKNTPISPDSPIAENRVQSDYEYLGEEISERNSRNISFEFNQAESNGQWTTYSSISSASENEEQCSTVQSVHENNYQVSSLDFIHEPSSQINDQMTPLSPTSPNMLEKPLEYGKQLYYGYPNEDIRRNNIQTSNLEFIYESSTKKNDQMTPLSPTSPNMYENSLEYEKQLDYESSDEDVHRNDIQTSDLDFIYESSAKVNDQMTPHSPTSSILEIEYQQPQSSFHMRDKSGFEHVSTWVMEHSRIKTEDLSENIERIDRDEYQYINIPEKHDEFTQTDLLVDYSVCNNYSDEKVITNHISEQETQTDDIEELEKPEEKRPKNQPKSGRRWSSCSTDKNLNLMKSIREKKVQKLIIRSEEFIENHYESLQILCRKHELMNPSYGIPIASGNSSRKMFSCRCDLPIKIFGALQYLGTVGLAPTSELSKQAAAKNMCNKLKKLLNYSQAESKNNPIQRKFDWCVVKKKKLRKPSLTLSSRLKYKVRLHSKRIIKKREWKLYKIDSPVRKIQYTEVRRMTANAIREMTTDKIKTVIMNEDNFWDQDYLETRLQEEIPLNLEDIEEKESEYSQSDIPAEIPKISEYYQMMMNTCGIDLREIVRARLSNLMKTTVERRCKVEEPFFIDRQLENLDDITALIDVQVSSTVFFTHDGRFIRLIHITSLPEIVEIEESYNLAGLGSKAFCRSLKKLIRLVT